MRIRIAQKSTKTTGRIRLEKILTCDQLQKQKQRTCCV
jgi:hypothetical protein